MTAPIGVLLLAHGAATDVADLPRYYEHIREGAPASPRVLEALEHRYRAIGGGSPLNPITISLATKLQDELDRKHPGQFQAAVGFRHVSPFIHTTLERLEGEGMTRALGIVLSPHMSRFVTEGYRRELTASKSRVKVELHGAWHMEPALLEHWRVAVGAALAKLPEDRRERARVLFTAHSLPLRAVQGDRLPDRLQESAAEVARRAGLSSDGFAHAWQSASPTGEEWLGPDVGEMIRREAAEGTRAIVACPHGFVADHLETLYDLDIVARGVAEKEGLAFVRTTMPDDRPYLVQALADMVERWASAPR